MADEDTFDLPPEQTGAGAVLDDEEGLTPAEFEVLVSGITHPEGDYIFLCTGVVNERPTAEKNPAGQVLKFATERALGGQVPKKGVTFDGASLTLKKFYQPSVDQKRFEGFDDKSAGQIAKAMGLGAPDPDGKIRPRAALVKGAQGKRMIAAIVHKDGFQNLRRFRALVG